MADEIVAKIVNGFQPVGLRGRLRLDGIIGHERIVMQTVTEKRVGKFDCNWKSMVVNLTCNTLYGRPLKGHLLSYKTNFVIFMC